MQHLIAAILFGPILLFSFWSAAVYHGALHRYHLFVTDKDRVSEGPPVNSVWGEFVEGLKTLFAHPRVPVSTLHSCFKNAPATDQRIEQQRQSARRIARRFFVVWLWYIFGFATLAAVSQLAALFLGR